MARCEDYPCCGHGPPPLGDGGGCPTRTTRPGGPCTDCDGTGSIEFEGDVLPCEDCEGTGTVTIEVVQWNCVDCGVLFEPTNSSLCPRCYARVGEYEEEPYDD